MITAEELLAGSKLTYSFEIPAELTPSAAPRNVQDGAAGNGTSGSGAAEESRGQSEPAGSRSVRLRPLTVHDLQLISRAAKESDSLTATLMVQRALVEPELSIPQVSSLPVGLVQFLLERVNEISGVNTAAEQVNAAMAAPITKAAFVLSREFGWTPQEVQALTLGQVLLHLEMLEEARE